MTSFVRRAISERADLAPHDLHVWAIALDPGRAQVAALAACLSDDEQDRARRFRFAHLERRYVVGRAAVRHVLGTYIGQSAAAVRFVYEPRGKPRLVGDEAVSFNLAHTDDLAILAVVGSGSVGVDVERVRDLPDFVDIAARFFSASEVDALDRAAPGDREGTFFRCWTRKEALLKATGQGLNLPLDAFTVTCAPNEPPRLVAVRGDVAGIGHWALSEIVPEAGYLGAVATTTVPRRISCWRATGLEDAA